MDIKRNRSTDSIDSEEERDVFDSNETEQQLYTEVRDILSKLTSKNFQKYLTIVRSLKINSCEKLHGIVNILFEEIINYESCALLCRELVLMPMLKCEELKKKFGLKFTTFRMLLYIRCEVELKKIFNEDQYLINLMYNDVYYISENEKEFQNEGKYFDKQLHETSITFIKFLGELYKQFVITNDILIKFMVNVFDEFDNVDQKCFRCLRYLLSAIGEELRKDFINSFYGRWKTVCRQTLESKVIEQRTDDKHVPEESEQSIFERNMYYKSRTLTSYSSVFKEVQENIRIKLENKERKVYTLENLLLLRNVPNSTKLPENYKETSICRLMDQTDIQDTFSTSPPAPYQIAIQNNTTIVIPEQQSLRKRQRSKQLTIDPNADACTDSVKTAVHNIVSSLHEIISPDNTATVILPHKSKLKQKRILIIDPDTGRKMYKLVEKHDENKSEPKSKQSSACQPVQSLVLEKSAITKEELHKIVNKTITKLTSSSLKSTVNTIASLKVNTYESVKYVIEIIMERAMNKSESCALLCKELDQMLVPTMGEFKNRKKLIIFRELLVARCVEDLYDVPSFTEEENPANELVVSLRLKHVGLVKFMRELHKNQMLTDAVVVDCIVHLLKTWRTNSEGNIECVCRLLLMFGEELEIRKVDLRSYFNTLKQICNNNQKKLSNLLRLISQSLLDLWIAKWSPEKQEICQILQNAYNPRITITQLYRKVRGILNKLTPQKFQTLLGQIQSLTIDTCERLQGVIDLVFEKAVDEPNFSVAYALLCRELALMQVPNSEEVRKKDGQEFVNFRKLLVTRCQREFEKNSVDEEERYAKVKEIEECADPEKKKELHLELEEYDRRLRMKSVGNIRFIGELYKQQMLTGNIMVRCIVNLLENKDEESLECLCKLLSTIGKELETKNMDLNPYFNTMKDIVDKKHGKVSSRVRFMLQDVIDLRNAKWVPRRQDMKPKTIDQIQQEAESEHMTNQALNALPLTKREDRGPNMSGSVKKMRNVTDDNGWSTARSNRPSPFAVLSDKLKNRVPLLNEPLGPSSNFDLWSKGSAMSKAGSTTATSTNNMYAPLEGLADAEKRGTRSNKDPYATKTSLERFAKFDDGRGSRSSSQQRSRDSSATSQRSGAGGGSRSSVIPPPQMPPLTKGQSAPPPQTTRPAPSFEIELTPEQLERRLKNILDEYLNECCTISECEEEITTTIPKSAHSNLVSDGYNGVLERSKTARVSTGKLFAHLIQRRTLSLEDYCKGLEEVLSVADDLTIDIPKIWDYLAEIIVPLITEESITFKVLHKCCELLITQSHTADLLAPLFQLIIQEEGAAFLQSRWRESGVLLEDFLPDTDINKFVSDAKVEFLLDSSSNVPSYKPTLTCDEITEKLLSFFNADASFDEITKWIETNLGDVVQEPYFIKALVTAIFQHSIVGNKLKDDLFKKHYICLHRFVVGSSEREIQCLYAVQALLNKMEYPQGLLLTIFEKLYEENVIPHESFISWEDSKDPAEQAGKGVALKQLTSFFTSLKEADDETGSSASEEP